MIHPNFQKYLNELTQEDKDDALYLVLYEALEQSIEIGDKPPTTEEFTACYKQAVERLSELDIPITEKGLLQTINGWMFVLLRDHPMFIIWYGRILGLTDDQWYKAIEEIYEDMQEPEYFLGEEAVANITLIKKKMKF